MERWTLTPRGKCYKNLLLDPFLRPLGVRFYHKFESRAVFQGFFYNLHTEPNDDKTENFFLISFLENPLRCRWSSLAVRVTGSIGDLTTSPSQTLHLRRGSVDPPSVHVPVSRTFVDP